MSRVSREFENWREAEEQEEIRMEQSVKVIGIDEFLREIGYEQVGRVKVEKVQ